MPGKKGDGRLARLRVLIGRALARCGDRAAAVRHAHASIVAIAHALEGTTADEPAVPATGAVIRGRVEAIRTDITATLAMGGLRPELHRPLAHVVTVLERLGEGLYHCYDVPTLPRTNNDLEHFYRQLKASERRTTGHRRSDGVVVRVGGFAAYAVAAATATEADLRDQLAGVPARAWQPERAVLRANQERQTKMRRFHLRRAAYIADLETRWAQFSQAP